jgi:hypothetical protein
MDQDSRSEREDLFALLEEGLMPLNLPTSYWMKPGQRYGT